MCACVWAVGGFVYVCDPLYDIRSCAIVYTAVLSMTLLPLSLLSLLTFGSCGVSGGGYLVSGIVASGVGIGGC